MTSETHAPFAANDQPPIDAGAIDLWSLMLHRSVRRARLQMSAFC
jgi:hypothetical protein